MVQRPRVCLLQPLVAASMRVDVVCKHNVGVPLALGRDGRSQCSHVDTGAELLRTRTLLLHSCVI